MDSNDTTDEISRNLKHQANYEIRIGENAKVTQHYPDLKNAFEGDDEEHLESPHLPILSVNLAKKNDCICQSENVLEGHTRSRPRSSYAPFDRNCQKKIIFNHCDQVDLQSLERGQELYTYPLGININQMMLIVRLVWIVTPGKKEK